MVQTIQNIPSEVISSVVTAIALGIIRAIEKRRLKKRYENGSKQG